MKIKWLAKAAIDIQEAYDFILFDNPAAAENQIEKVMGAVNCLADNPGMGKAGRVAGTREMVVSETPYIVIYRVKDHFLEILRILHGARQWPERNRK